MANTSTYFRCKAIHSEKTIKTIRITEISKGEYEEIVCKSLYDDFMIDRRVIGQCQVDMYHLDKYYIKSNQKEFNSQFKKVFQRICKMNI